MSKSPEDTSQNAVDRSTQNVVDRSTQKEELNKSTLLETKQLNNLQLELHRGDLVTVPADIIAMSANNWLMHGSGSARAVAEAGGLHTMSESQELFRNLLVSKQLHTLPLWISDEHVRAWFEEISKIQAASFQAMLQQPIDSETGIRVPLEIGSIKVLDSFELKDENLGKPQSVMALVGMGYTVERAHRNTFKLAHRIETTEAAILRCLHAALQYIDENKLQELSLPLLGASKGGMTVAASAESMIDSITRLALFGAGTEKVLKLILSNQISDEDTEAVIAVLKK